MSVSGKTTTYQVPYFLETDKPPDMAAVTKAIAERVEALLAKGGDVSIAADGTVTIGAGKVTEGKLGDKAVATAKLGDGAVTRSKIAGASFQTKRESTGTVEPGDHLITITWPTAFADTSYTVGGLSVEVGLGTTGAALTIVRIDAKEKDKLKIVVRNESGSNKTGTVHAVAWHD
jgi:hypothetical protein